MVLTDAGVVNLAPLKDWKDVNTLSHPAGALGSPTCLKAGMRQMAAVVLAAYWSFAFLEDSTPVCAVLVRSSSGTLNPAPGMGVRPRLAGWESFSHGKSDR